MVKVYTVVGALWGDEGKGKFVNYLCNRNNADIAVRFNGGSNAGHCIHTEEFGTVMFRTLPTGSTRPGTTAVLGNGMVIDPEFLLKEIKVVRAINPDFKLLVDKRAHLVLPIHQKADGNQDDERKQSIGTTRSGNGPAYSDKAFRAGVRVQDLYRLNWELDNMLSAVVMRNGGGVEDLRELEKLSRKWREELSDYVGDGSAHVNDAISEGATVVFAGAQGVLLDIDHGDYPFVTSSNCIPAAVGTGAGVDPRRVDDVVGVVKAYSTRIGEGPLPTEIRDEEVAEHIRRQGNEYEIGVHIHRPRRIGWLDAEGLRRSARVCNYDYLAITLLDALNGLERIEIPGVGTMPGWNADISKAKSMDDLPTSMCEYISEVENIAGCRVGLVSTGPHTDQVIDLRSEWR